jgi:hypothetical protein
MISVDIKINENRIYLNSIKNLENIRINIYDWNPYKNEEIIIYSNFTSITENIVYWYEPVIIMKDKFGIKVEILENDISLKEEKIRLKSTPSIFPIEHDIKNMKGIRLSGPKIGDKVQYSSFPENYFLNTGQLLIDVDKSWIFDYNPYVIRTDIPYEIAYPDLEIIDIWQGIGVPGKDEDWKKSSVIKSIAERTCNLFNFKTFLRHYRLYKFEDTPLKSNQIVVHLQGNTFGTVPNYVAEQILKNYEGFDLLLIGGKYDKYIPGFINKLGLDLWDTAKLISESPTYIGLSSGFLGVSLCYPRVNKKVLLMEDSSTLKNLIPMDANNPDYHWLDHSFSFFNIKEEDIGVSFSYKKI